MCNTCYMVYGIRKICVFNPLRNPPLYEAQLGVGSHFIIDRITDYTYWTVNE